MPRGLIPNARCLKNPDYTVLPFLAPRVFAEPAVPRGNVRQSEQSRNKKEKKDVEDINSGGSSAQLKRFHGVHPSVLPAPISDSRWPSPVHPPTLLNSNGSRRPSPNISGPMKSCPQYAEICRFVRQFSSTSHASATSQTEPVIPEAAATASEEPLREHTRPSARVENVSHHADLDRKRHKILKRYLPKYENADSLYPSNSNDQHQRRLDSSYRTLERVVYNHWRHRPEEVAAGPLAFAALDRRFPSKFTRYTFPLTIAHDPICREWAEELFHDECSKIEMASKWKAINRQSSPVLKRVTKWHGKEFVSFTSPEDMILLYLLDRHPRWALQFLEITGCDEGRDPILLANALEYLARHYSYTRSPHYDTEKVGHALARIFMEIFEKHLRYYTKICSQDLLFHIANLADQPELPKMYNNLCRREAHMKINTLTHWAQLLGKIEAYPQAFSCLKRAVEITKTVSEPPQQHIPLTLAQACVVILLHCGGHKHNLHRTADIIADFIGLGLQPDAFVNNVVIRNTVQSGDLAMAFDVYNLMERTGVQADPATYSTLLKGCTESENPAHFADFAELCAKKAEELRDTWLATDYLYYVQTRSILGESDPWKCRDILLDVYLRFFDLSPLEELIPRLRPTAKRRRSELAQHGAIPEEALQPSPMALCVLLHAELRAETAHGQAFGDKRVLELYQHFRSLVMRSRTSPDAPLLHPSIREMASQTYIYNLFMKAFCERHQFASASQVLSDMTADSSAPSTSLSSSPLSFHSPIVQTPKPGIIAWTIFMQGFFSSDQVSAAERVFHIMRSRGVEPDEVTWRLLLREYAKRNMLDRASEVLEQVDETVELDLGLLRVLARAFGDGNADGTGAGVKTEGGRDRGADAGGGLDKVFERARRAREERKNRDLLMRKNKMATHVDEDGDEVWKRVGHVWRWGKAASQSTHARAEPTENGNGKNSQLRENIDGGDASGIADSEKSQAQAQANAEARESSAPLPASPATEPTSIGAPAPIPAPAPAEAGGSRVVAINDFLSADSVVVEVDEQGNLVRRGFVVKKIGGRMKRRDK